MSAPEPSNDTFPTVAQFQAGYDALPAPKQGRATVHHVVLRLGGGEHAMPDLAKLSTTGGVIGDRWAAAEEPDLQKQVTLMNVDVARLVCNGQPLHMPGDNFLVDLDLSEAHLPIGTHIRLGTALLEISEKPHRGCKKFAQRFGKDAMRWLNAKHRWPLRLRGVNCRIIEDGAVSVGDTIEVIAARTAAVSAPAL